MIIPVFAAITPFGSVVAVAALVTAFLVGVLYTQGLFAKKKLDKKAFGEWMAIFLSAVVYLVITGGTLLFAYQDDDGNRFGYVLLIILAFIASLTTLQVMDRFIPQINSEHYAKKARRSAGAVH